MDWLDCPVIEQVAGKLSGQPVIRQSRVRPQDLLNNLDQSEEWMAENFGLALEDVREVLRFYGRHREQLAHTA
jgi:uncharacterized protein (DUF433 family)